MKKLLLHVCCAPCASHASYTRLSKQYDLTWYFCNPNIVSKEEYDKRLAAVKFVSDKFNWSLIIEPYDHKAWQEFSCSRASDPEKGVRCQLCYHDRLAKTAQLAKSKKFDLFSTTLLVSPYKDKEAILKLGRDLGFVSGVEFLEEDFQANNGYRKSQEFAKDLGLYRQKFCGCEYSISPKLALKLNYKLAPTSDEEKII